MTDEDSHQITVGELDEIAEKVIIIRLNQEINPENISDIGVIGIDVIRARSNLRKLARALNSIKFSNTANPNLSEIIAEPSLITMNNQIILRKEQYFLQ